MYLSFTQCVSQTIFLKVFFRQCDELRDMLDADNFPFGPIKSTYPLLSLCTRAHLRAPRDDETLHKDIPNPNLRLRLWIQDSADPSESLLRKRATTISWAIRVWMEVKKGCTRHNWCRYRSVMAYGPADVLWGRRSIRKARKRKDELRTLIIRSESVAVKHVILPVYFLHGLTSKVHQYLRIMELGQN